MNFRYAVLVALALGACSGNPFTVVPDDGGGTGGGGTTDSGVPDAIAKNLRAITYNPAGQGTLSVNMSSEQSSPQTVNFVRDATRDIPGYRAFTYQETGLTRKHLAFVADNARGNLRAAAVGDGGQFNIQHGGGSYERIGVYSKPTVGVPVENGQFSYAGTYAGVFVSSPGTHPTLPDGLQPGTPLGVRGDALITGNFANDLVEGGVDNRYLLTTSGAIIDFNRDGRITVEDQLAGVTFRETAINADGQFLGEVEFEGKPGQAIGNYGGLFGGTGATDVAGAIVINPIEGESGIWEYGVFNLPRCDLAGASALCIPR
ncbi:MAG: hypothetical protein WCC57_04795 [Paracoccaceae bacterium]